MSRVINLRILLPVFLALLPIAATAQNAVVLEPAPMYLNPRPSLTPVLVIEPDVEVTIVRREGAWTIIRVEDSRGDLRSGYVESRFLRRILRSEPVREPAEAPAPESTATADNKQTTDRKAKPEATGAETSAKQTPAAPASTNQAKPGAPSDNARVASSEIANGLASASTSRSERPLLTPTKPVPRSGGYTEQQLASNIRIGFKGKGRDQGLQLADSAQRFLAALGSTGNGAIASNGFSLSAYTPMAWLRQLASEAAKEYPSFTTVTVTEEMLEPVFRAVVRPDTPNTVTATGMRGTSSVQHVVLRDESRTVVVQPLSKETFVEEVANAVGGRATFEGVRVKFSMDDVRELRGSRGDREFFITVIGTGSEEKNFRVKKKHFDDLP